MGFESKKIQTKNIEENHKEMEVNSENVENITEFEVKQEIFEENSKVETEDKEVRDGIKYYKGHTQNYIFVKYKTNEELENRFYQYRQNPRNVHISWVFAPANLLNLRN